MTNHTDKLAARAAACKTREDIADLIVSGRTVKEVLEINRAIYNVGFPAPLTKGLINMYAIRAGL